MAKSLFIVDEIRTALLESIKAGNYEGVSCDLVGIGRSTYWGWLKRGEEEQDDPESEYAKFSRQIRQAKAEAVHKAIKVVIKAGDDGNFLAAKWWLSKAVPDVYGDYEWRLSKLQEQLENQQEGQDIEIEIGKPHDKTEV